MLRKIGRIILIVTGLGMLGFAGYTIYQDMMAINAHGGWANFFSDIPFAMTMILEFVWELTVIFVGISAFFAGLFGHCGLWFIVFIVVMLTIFIWNSIVAVQHNRLDVMSFAIYVTLQVLYIAGFILYRIGVRKDKKEYKAYKKAIKAEKKAKAN